MTARAVRIACVAVLLGLGAGGTAGAQVPPISGELRLGDRVLLRVEGEPQLTDTFTVAAGPALELPGVGSVSLTGVHRADVDSYLGERVGRYFKRSDVRAWALVRLSIVGEVDRPGFYAVPAELVLADAVMVTGGPTREARVKAMRIERNGTALWRGDELQRVLGAGYTVDQLGLRDGDQITFPRESRSGVLPVIGILMAVPAAVFATAQLLH